VGTQEGTLRVALRSDDPYLCEQVRRVAAAAGAVVVEGSDPGAGLVVVDDEYAEGTAPRPPDGVPVVRVCGTRMRRRRERESTGEDVLELPADAELLLRALGAAACVPRARLVAVLGARGGVGASTLAAALARAAVRAGACTALVDLDASGGGLDVLLGAEHEPGLRWADLRAERAGFPPQALSLALPSWCGVRVLSGDVRGASAVAELVVDDAVRALAGAHDLLVLDVPRAVWWARAEGSGGGTGERTTAAWLGEATTIVVAGCDVRSAVAAATLRGARPDGDLRLVLRVPGPGGLHPEEVAQAAGLPLAATVRTERGGRAAAEHGQAPGDNRRGSIARTAVRLVADLLGEP
jgi:secretion/DNA translocation related CpaE-like protein